MKVHITAKQIEVLCTFFEENPEVIKGYKKTTAGINAVQMKWKKITPHLNSLGVERYHKSWAKYLCNVKAKLKRKSIKWRQSSDGTGPIICNAEDFSELELRMLQVLQINTSEIPQDPNNSDGEDNIESGSDDVEISWQERTVADKPIRKESHIKLLDGTMLSEMQKHDCNNLSSDDEFTTFGKNIAQQLRKLPIAAALETQEILLSVLRKQRLKVLRKLNNCNKRKFR